jgi:opacity protein-like surface antigen
MKKTVFLTTIILLFSATASEAQYSDLYYPQSYFKASMGYSNISSNYNDPSGELKFESSTLTPIQLGYGVSVGHLSFEGELGFHFFEFDFNAVDPAFSYMGDMTAFSLMANAIYKANPNGAGLYIGGGLGLMSVSLDGLEDELKGASIAVQALAGLDIKVNPQASFYFEGRFMRTLGLDIENDFAFIDFDLEQMGVNVGLKYYF